MKFTTQFLTVLAATVTLAAPAAKSCDEILDEKYLNCISIVREGGFNENYCIEYETEKCQKFFKSSMKDIVAEIPECKDKTEKDLKQSDGAIKFVDGILKISCAKDEQGNFCPYSPGNTKTAIDIRDFRKSQRNEAYIGYLKESCKSKKCVDNYINALESIKNLPPIEIIDNMDDKEIEEITTYLKSETCTAQTVQTAPITNTSVNGNNNANASNTNASNTNASNTNTSNTNASNTNANGKTNTSNGNNDNKTDAKSGATQITYSSILFVSLAILLSALY